ncbi:S8 family serine peptidase [Fictibacillus terranigra]|uniref:S8 family serine peptidase n=1 Tax=Fictibacillus terranigra TaxID=3058424 RepID=A0ABT8E226_9BACL|nr:S8 family serine peptidase [Fictibacillus sp. CENA-BCM004]MDN4071978.1 S8 family serine peptidase [Fictibacillus sp. CENA-BCM004]
MNTFKRTLSVITAGLVGTSLLGSAVHAQGTELAKRNMFFSTQTIEQPAESIDLANVNKREIIVKTKEGSTFAPSAYGLVNTASPSILKEEGISVYQIPNDKNYEKTLNQIKEDQAVDYAEPNYVSKKSAEPVLPNDKLYDQQWALKKINWTKNLVNPSAGQKPVIVAVLDTGVNANHPDLQGKLLKGKDFVNNLQAPTDTVGHGTEVTGIIGATTDNKIGISGLNNYVKILPVRVGGKVSIPNSSVIAGLHYAINQGAKVINMSFGSAEPSQAEYDAIMEAVRKGITLVAASGNENPVYGVNYPAAYPQVISVGATRYNDTIAPFSSRGPELDVVAPGTDIMTTLKDRTYGQKGVSGTSFSAPMVSGLASLLLTKNPSLTPQQIEYMIEKSAYKPNRSGYNTAAGLTDFYGYGRIDAAKALETNFPSLSGDTTENPAKAKWISKGTVYKDKFDVPFDGDMHRFKLTKEYNVKIEVSAAAGMDPVIAVDRVSRDGKLTYEKIADKSGVGKAETWYAKLKPGINYVTVYEANNHWSAKPYSMKLTAYEAVAPAAPNVNKVDSNDKYVTGKAEKKSRVEVKKGNTVIGKTTASSTGAYKAPIKVQKRGMVLYVTATDAAGNKSKPTKITVK